MSWPDTIRRFVFGFLLRWVAFQILICSIAYAVAPLAMQKIEQFWFESLLVALLWTLANAAEEVEQR